MALATITSTNSRLGRSRLVSIPSGQGPNDGASDRCRDHRCHITSAVTTTSGTSCTSAITVGRPPRTNAMAVATITNICEPLPSHWDDATSPIERYVAITNPDGIANSMTQPRIQAANDTY